MAYAKYRKAEAHTPSSTEHGIEHDGVWVGTGGNITAIFAKDTTEVTIIGVPSGTLLPFELKELRTSTTAADLVLLESGMKGSG